MSALTSAKESDETLHYVKSTTICITLHIDSKTPSPTATRSARPKRRFVEKPGASQHWRLGGGRALGPWSGRGIA